MKFKTSDLIARIDDLVALRIKAADDAHAAELAKVSDKRAEWLAEHGPAFVEFADRIKEKIRKGRPILRSDVPRNATSRYNEFAVFIHSEKPSKKNADIGDLLTLKAALLAVADEYVTTTGLREIGFKEISRLFAVGRND